MDLVIALAFVLTVILAEFLLAVRLDIAGVFDQYDAMFDTDPVFWHRVFAHGWDRGDVYHPLLTYYFSVPNRAIAWLAGVVGITHDQLAYRRTLALLVAPLVTGIKIGMLYLVLRRLELPRPQAVIGTVFAALAFSSLLFGAVPESYPVTGMAFCLLVLHALLAPPVTGQRRFCSELALTVFSVGITVSNVIFCGWTLFARRMDGLGITRAFGRAVAMGALALLLAVGGSAALDWVRGPDPANPPVAAGDQPRFMKFTNPPAVAARKLVEFPAFLTLSFVPVVPGQTGNEIGESNLDRYRLQFTYNDGSPLLMMLLAMAGVLVFGGGAIVAHRAGGAWRWVAWCSLLSIVSYGLLYSYFGRNTYLYSQVWYVPCVLLASAWLRLDFMRTRRGILVLTSALLLLLAADLRVLHSILGVLSASA